jgi:hypothetical protein
MGVPIAAVQGSYIARNLNEIGIRILSKSL